MDSEIPFATLDTEAEALQPWLSAFARYFEQPVQVTTDAEGGTRLVCPRVFQPIELIGGSNHFKMYPAVVEHIRRLGFDWEPDGRVLTVPTPATFNQRLAKYGQADAGFRLAWVREQSSTIALGPWLHRYMRGMLTVQSCTQRYFDDLLVEGPKGRFAAPLGFLLSSLIHDLSVHALNYHLIPHMALADLAERIEKAVPERVAQWQKPGATAPVTLTYFYDNDLNRYTYAVWCRTQSPEAFSQVFMKPQSYEQLLAALDVRLQETTAGIGDVPSGQVEHLKQPLQPTKFDIP